MQVELTDRAAQIVKTSLILRRGATHCGQDLGLIYVLFNCAVDERCVVRRAKIEAAAGRAMTPFPPSPLTCNRTCRSARRGLGFSARCAVNLITRDTKDQ
jgi:hypothetical protein